MITTDFEALLDIFNLLILFLTSVPPLLTDYLNQGDHIAFQYDFPKNEIDAVNSLARNTFPERFLFGVNILPYGSDSAAEICDKEEEPAWDYLTQQNCCQMISGDYKNSICRSYQRYKEDVILAQNLDAEMINIFLCWSWILPNGIGGPINEDAIEHYSDVIDEIIDYGITPMITLFQRDTPYPLQQLGSWTNPMIVEWFAAYARIAFTAFGNRVKFWMTMNDPVSLCTHGYGNTLTPSVSLSGIADYLCGHHVLLSHAKVYNLYRKEFWIRQKGKVGIGLNSMWFEPKNKDSMLDITAVEMGFQWYNGWFMNPLFGKDGDYPAVMKERITFKSHIQEFRNSRLPCFTEVEINDVKGAADFLGVNFYTAKQIQGFKLRLDAEISFDRDADIQIVSDNWPGETSFKNTPWALGKLLHRLNNDYILPEIYVTGNGYMDNGQIKDVGRAIYYYQHISEVLRAMQTGIDIRGYLAWNLLDNFKSRHSNATTFGLFYVDEKDARLQRRPKLSTTILSNIYVTKRMNLLSEIIKFATSMVNDVENIF